MPTTPLPPLALSVCLGLVPGAEPTGGQTADEAPGAERGLVLAADGAFAGYTLYAPLKSTNTYLVDMQGEVAHVWRHAFAPGLAVYLLEDGTLIRCSREPERASFRGGGQGGRVQRVDWEGAVLWDWRCSDDERMQHHDVEPLANGNLLVLAWEKKTREQAIAAGRDPFEVEDDGMWSEVVLEVEPVPPEGARVVWEWHAWDHLVQELHEGKPDVAPIASRPRRIDANWDVVPEDAEPDAAALEREQQLAESMRDLGYVGDDPVEPADASQDGDGARQRKGRERRDWLHLNSIDHHAALDLVLVGGRHTSEVWIIDHATTSEEARGPAGDLVWRWGNPGNHGGGGERMLFGPHDARWIAPEDSTDLRFTVFDNGEGRPAGAWSRVLEVLAPVEIVTRTALEPGAIARGEVLWSYSAPDPATFYSSFISGAERLANGNTLICSGEQGRIFEVTHDGAVVWDYANPHGVELPPALRPPEGDDPPAPDGVFRATRLAPHAPGIVALLRAREVGERERAERIQRKRAGG